jgi:hypothetical protein
MSESTYIERASALYRTSLLLDSNRKAEEGAAFRRSLFELDIDCYLGRSLLSSKRRRLLEAKDILEHGHDFLIELLEHGGEASEYVTSFNAMTHDFQDSIAEVLNNNEYMLFMNVSRQERIDLVDPDSLAEAYGSQTVRLVYPELNAPLR